MAHAWTERPAYGSGDEEVTNAPLHLLRVKAILIALLAFSLCLSAVGADKKPLTKEESAKVIEAAIRKELNKPTGELTEADLELVMLLYLDLSKPTGAGLKEVAKLKNLTNLHLNGTKVTKAGVAEL